ncbi:MAG TPA: hypothetical protein VFH78_09695 [Candidatus Thermoplasmatota archaeon]|nr:hypothetical protein [Candidatus Thermoplasmatota archaeon]
MRPLLPVLVLLLLAPAALAQPPGGPVATLTLDVQEDASERGTLAFDGLRRLTRYESICLPERATETRVYDDLGDLQYEGRQENGRRTLSFLARGDNVRIDLTRAPLPDAEFPLYGGDVNFCVPADSRVVVTVRVPERHTLFFMSGGAELAPREATTRAAGPTHVFYSYEAPLDARRPITLLDVPPYRVFVATSLAPQAQEVAQLAAAPLHAALQEAGLEVPFDALRVLYAEETPHAWEAGHYNGHGYVLVKEDTLNGDPTQGYPISGVRVLVHEAFHAVSFPYGKGHVDDEVAWWLEGTAKHAERHVDAAMPNATRHCARSAAEVRCWDFDDRIRRAEVEAAYDPSFTFDPDWSPALPQTDDTRRFYYAYSEYVVAAWIQRHSVDEYQRVWDIITGAFERGEGCPCPDGWLETLLDDPDLFRPWQDVRATDPRAFNELVQPHVKDEAALQRELQRQANPLAGIPAPAWAALLATLAAAAARARRAGE